MAVPAIYDYLVYMLRQRTPVLGWSFGAVFSCFLVYVLAVIVRSAAAALKLLGSRWREEA